MRVLVTGAEGFVGRRLVETLREAGHDIVAAVRPGLTPPPGVRVRQLELQDAASVAAALAPEQGRGFDAVVHLAAVASGGDALGDPGLAWEVNAAGTARVMTELGRQKKAGAADPVVLLVSTAEVYRRSGQPHRETDPVEPCSPYAASKLGAEIAARETAARTGLRLLVARSFPHTGPGQDTRFVVAAFAQRLKIAKQAGARVIKVGNLEPVRDLTDVRDVVRAYALLLARRDDPPGETYNVATGRGWSMEEILRKLAAAIGVDVIPEADPALLRPSDLPVLVGDASKLKRATGWEPRITLEQTLTDLVHAQAD